MTILRKQSIASTNLDLHGEQRTTAQLWVLFDGMPAEDVLCNRHNPGDLPVARTFNKQFVQLTDGQYVIQVDIEVYDEAMFQTMGGYSISYTTDHYTVDPSREAELEILFNPREFSPDEFKRLACKTDDGLQISVVKLHQKGLAGAAILILKFVGLATAAWFIKKLLDGTLELFKTRLVAQVAQRRSVTGADTTFQLTFPVIIDGTEVSVLVELCSRDFARLGVGEVVFPDVEAIVLKPLKGRSARQAVLRLAQNAPEWILSHAVTTKNKILLFKDNPNKAPEATSEPAMGAGSSEHQG